MYVHKETLKATIERQLMKHNKTLFENTVNCFGNQRRRLVAKISFAIYQKVFAILMTN